MNPVPSLYLMPLLALWAVSPPLGLLAETSERVLYTSTAGTVHLGDSDLTVAKTAGSMRFEAITEMGEAPDLQLRFDNPEAGIITQVTVYPAPEGTAGPEILRDEQGKPLPAHDPENPYAVYRLSDPSAAFLEEFDAAVAFIEERFYFEMTNEGGHPIRMLAVPEDQVNSAIGYVAGFPGRGTGAFRHPQLSEVPWEWSFRFYVNGEHFVKIHTEGSAGLETSMAASDMVSAVGWLGSGDEVNDGNEVGYGAADQQEP